MIVSIQATDQLSQQQRLSFFVFLGWLITYRTFCVKLDDTFMSLLLLLPCSIRIGPRSITFLLFSRYGFRLMALTIQYADDAFIAIRCNLL